MSNESKPPITGQADITEEGDTIQARAKVPPLHELILELGRDSHAGSVLIAASQLENAVRQLVLDRLPNLSKTVEARLFKGYGPFASFEVNIEVAYAMDQIDLRTRDDLNAIRRVRNRFAHSTVRLHFGSNEIIERLRSFSDYDREMDPYAFFLKKINDCWAVMTPRMKNSALISFLRRGPPSSKPAAPPQKS